MSGQMACFILTTWYNPSHCNTYILWDACSGVRVRAVRIRAESEFWFRFRYKNCISINL